MNFPDREIIKRAAVLGGSAALTITTVQAQAQEINGIWTDGGQFPQCTTVQSADRGILSKNPLEYSPDVPLHPEVRYAWQTLSANGLYDLLAINLAPQNFRLKPIYTLTSMETKCLPDFLNTPYRAAIQTAEGVGLMLPSGNKENLIDVTLPEGRSAVILSRYAQVYQGGEKGVQEWIFFNMGGNEITKFANVDGSWGINVNGPLALPLRVGGIERMQVVPIQQ